MRQGEAATSKPGEAQLQRVIAGEAAAVRAFVAELSPVVGARVMRVLRRWRGAALGREIAQECEDLCQEVFMALFSDGAAVLRRWDSARGLSLENYVGLVAERNTISILRTGRRNPWTEDPTEDVGELNTDGAVPDLDASVATRDLLEALANRIQEQVSPLGWQLFLLLMVRQMSTEEVMEEMGMRRDAVNAWRSRLAKLARKLAQTLLTESTGPPVESVHG